MNNDKEKDLCSSCGEEIKVGQDFYEYSKDIRVHNTPYCISKGEELYKNSPELVYDFIKAMLRAISSEETKNKVKSKEEKEINE